MKIFDSSNPLFTAMAAGSIVSFVPSTQGTFVPQITLSGGAHIVPSVVPAASRDVLQWGNTAGNKPLQYDLVTLSGVSAGDSVIINGTTFTAVSGAATGAQFTVGASDADTAVNLAASFNAYSKTGKGAWFRVNGAKTIFSAKVSGTGNVSASATIEVSVNGIDGITHPGQSALAPTGSNSAVAIGVEVDTYPFVRANVTALSGTNAVVEVSMSQAQFN